MMYYLKLKDDRHGRRWKVREAVSIKAACNCIILAMATGSVGGKDTRTKQLFAGGGSQGLVVGTETVVLADVVCVHPDNTEVQPS